MLTRQPSISRLPHSHSPPPHPPPPLSRFYSRKLYCPPPPLTLPTHPLASFSLTTTSSSITMSSSSSTKPSSKGRTHSNTKTPLGHPHFRPIAYHTQHELDTFFGISSQKKNDLALRVKDEDGRMYFDSIEKDEWQHLLGISSPNRRRSSGQMSSGESSSISLLGARRLSEAQSPTSPLSLSFTATNAMTASGSFAFTVNPEFSWSTIPENPTKSEGDVGAMQDENQTDKEDRQADKEDQQAYRRGRKARVKKRHSFSQTNLSAQPLFGNQKTDIADPTNQDHIYISRLPLARRKPTRQLLDEAFPQASPHRPLHNYQRQQQMARLEKFPKRPRPAPLALNQSHRYEKSKKLSPLPSSSSSCSNVFLSLSSQPGNRGTFGAFDRKPSLSPNSPLQEILESPNNSINSKTPASSSTWTTSNIRSYASIDIPRNFVSSTPRAIKFKASLSSIKSAISSSSSSSTATSLSPPKGPSPKRGDRETVSDSEGDMRLSWKRRASSTKEEVVTNKNPFKDSWWEEEANRSSESMFETSLVPRTGAKKLARAKRGDPSKSLQDTPTCSNKNALDRQSTSLERLKATRGYAAAGGLKTGQSVYQGLEIPCPSVPLDSDIDDDDDRLSITTASSLTLPTLQNKSRKMKQQQLVRDPKPSQTESERKHATKGLKKWWAQFVRKTNA